MVRKKIVILVDNPLRDLPACTLLAAYLSVDFKVYLVPTAQATQEIFRLNPDIVLLNYLRDTNLPLVRKLIRAEIAFSILDTEGGIFMNIPGTNETSYTMTLVKDEFVRNQVSQVFCWGENLANALKARKAYPENRIFCLGTPRMDFYHRDFRPFFGDLSVLKSQLTAQTKPVILINTSFAGNNPKFSDRATELEMLIQKFSYDRKFMSDFFDQMDTVMQSYIELTRFLAERFPELHFVLRPHPFENFDVYNRAFAEIRNVQVDCSKTVAPWLLISEALIHYECSTAIEAAFVAKPSLSLSEYKDIRPVESVQSITDYARDFEDMKTKLSQIVSGKYQISAGKMESLKKVEKSIFNKIDGQAYIRTGDAVASWLSQKSGKPSKKAIFYRLITSAFMGIRSVAKFLLKGYLLPDGKKIKVQETNEICQQLRSAIPVSAKASVVSLSTSIEISSFRLHKLSQV